MAEEQGKQNAPSNDPKQSDLIRQESIPVAQRADGLGGFTLGLQAFSFFLLPYP